MAGGGRHGGGPPHGPGDPRWARWLAGGSGPRIEGYLDLGPCRKAPHRGHRRAPGGAFFGRKGWFVEPTVLHQRRQQERNRLEEIFGPVLVVIPYDGDEPGGHRDRQRLQLRAGYWFGPATTTVARVWPARGGPAPTCSTPRCRSTSPRRSAGTRSWASAAQFGPEGLESFLEKKSIALPAGYTPQVC